MLNFFFIDRRKLISVLPILWLTQAYLQQQWQGLNSFWWQDRTRIWKTDFATCNECMIEDAIFIASFYMFAQHIWSDDKRLRNYKDCMPLLANKIFWCDVLQRVILEFYCLISIYLNFPWLFIILFSLSPIFANFMFKKLKLFLKDYCLPLLAIHANDSDVFTLGQSIFIFWRASFR